MTLNSFLLLAIVVVIAMFFILGIFSHSGAAYGLIDGKLSQCPDKPNCISSERYEDVKHRVDAIIISKGQDQDALRLLRKLIVDMGGRIQTESRDYLAVTFTSRVFRFVDDLELRVDRENARIHLRSASRVGRSDLGANRRRIEQLKQRYVHAK